MVQGQDIQRHDTLKLRRTYTEAYTMALVTHVITREMNDGLMPGWMLVGIKPAEQQ